MTRKGRTVKTIAICLPMDLYEELQQRAFTELLPVSRYVARILRDEFARETTTEEDVEHG